MAVMSFAHLKRNHLDQASAVVVHGNQTPVQVVAEKKGVASFAHLKKAKTNQDQPATDKQVLVVLQRPRSIGIMTTALLAAANYCEGCPRFWPSNDQEKAMGVPYGRCMRKEDEEYEYWRSIPLTAQVYRCWWHQQREIDRNTYGPHPDTTMGKEWSINLRSEL